MFNLLILTDGGGRIGFGHLVRCLAIKDAWKHGAHLLAHMEDDVAPSDGVEIFDWLNQPEKLTQFSSENTIVLVDSYRPSKNYFLLLKGLFKFVVVLDDYNRITYPVDLVICPGIYGEDMDYNNQTCIPAGGAKYVVIRPDILAAKQIRVSKNIESILVTFGGSQYDKALYQRAIELIESSGYKAIVVTGNDKLAKKIVSKSSKIYGRLDPVTMAEVMASVDMAVSAAGQTLNELAWLGVPTFSIRTGVDQQENWEYYNSHSLSLAAALHDNKNWESELKMVLKNETYKSRLERSHRLKNLLTAKGSEEICSLIDERFEG
jgi:UDP-2,4-diacetamido-2,4,6-trideoxy-beta-L-altropyranose hydrolase